MSITYRIDARSILHYIMLAGKTPVRVFIHVDYKPRFMDGEDKSRKVAKDEIPSLESQLQGVGQQIKAISRAIDHARHQEVYLKEIGGTVKHLFLKNFHYCSHCADQTSSLIRWFSILSIVILLSASVWQLIYLRSFFASKKLL